MVKLYDKNFKEEDIDNVKPGDVIVYEGKNDCLDNYLVVESVDVKGRKISGQIACTIGVNCVPLEMLVNGTEK
jgi:hypothetical protein